MKEYLSNRLFKIGATIALIGWTPLLAIILLAWIGLWPDPNPNPIGPGLLFFILFWPAMIFLGLGAFQVWRGRRKRGGAQQFIQADATSRLGLIQVLGT